MELQKIAKVLIMCVLITGCSVGKIRKNNAAESPSIVSSEFSGDELQKQNLTNTNFYIQKAEIEIVDDGERRKFLATIKFAAPDSFLISLRTLTGIEAARVFLTKDTVLINDRLSKVLLYGSTLAGRKKYGLSAGIIPLIFGDVLLTSNEIPNIYSCNEEYTEVESALEGYNVSYLISCKWAKPVLTTIINEIERSQVKIRFDEFRMTATGTYAGSADISEVKGYESIKVKYSKVIFPWDGDMVFLPGNNYELVEIR